MNDMGLGQNLMAAKHAALEMAEQRCRENMRLMMPQDSVLIEKYPGLTRPDSFFALRHCNKCNPPAKVYTCPVCDAGTNERWQMQVHNMVGPNESCDVIRRKKQRAWAARN